MTFDRYCPVCNQRLGDLYQYDRCTSCMHKTELPKEKRNY